MGTYIIGDIHGCFEDFLQMLNVINYNNNDEIICVGDYIDRGSQNYEMLRWIEDYPYNILLIRGNHEDEFIANIEILDNFANELNIDKTDIYSTKLLYQTIVTIPQIKNAYFDYYNTIFDLIHNNLTNLYQLKCWSDIMRKMPYIYKKQINGIKHIITHAGCDVGSIDCYIYSRKATFVNNSIIIAGHTPTILKDSFSFNNGYIYKKYNSKLNSTYINIDCGCVYKKTYVNARLACLRLEDMKEFYV